MKTKRWGDIEKRYLGVIVEKEIHDWLRVRSYEEDKSLSLVIHEILAREVKRYADDKAL